MMSTVFEGSMDGANLTIAIVATRWNDFIVERLLAGAKSALTRHGVSPDRIDIAMAPGAYEVPFIAKKLAQTGRYNGIVTLGCVIRGATAHFEYVSGEAANGIGAVARETGVPISFGVLTVENIEQAIERAGTKAGNKGEEAALTTLELINLSSAIENAP